MGRLPIQLSQASGIPYYRQVVDQVAQLVGAGQLDAGTRLPSVRELSSQLLVSLITVRRAYSDLEAAGLIVRKQGQGTFVAETARAPSRRYAQEEARHHLAEALARARRVGLGGDELRSFLEKLLAREASETDTDGSEGDGHDSE
jgi:GntR family transcriptional regulator